MKIDFHRDSYLSLEEINSNKAYAHSLGLPDARQIKTTSRRLAVIGGGPSIERYAPEIAAFDGDRWAINAAYHWCKDREMEAAFFSLDQTTYMRSLVDGIDRAILSSACDRQVFDALNGRDIYIADFSEGGFASGSSSVTAVPFLSIAIGYREIVFYGCESSYESQTHAYLDEPPEFGMIVSCNGNQFATSAQMFMQAQELSAFINACPDVFKEHCGGLLRAMIESKGDYDVISVSAALQARIVEKAA